MYKKLVLLAAVFMLLLTGCDPNRVYEQNVDFAEGNWAIDNAPEFTFDIKDTSHAYNIYFNVRYSLQYEFYNLYLRHQLIGPEGEQVSSDLHELLLMDDKTGKPLGKGSSDMYDLQTLALKNVTFSKIGTYKIRLIQYMRRDPLPHVQAVGVRVASAAAQ